MLSRQSLSKVGSILLFSALLVLCARDLRPGRAAPVAALAEPYLVYDFNPDGSSGLRNLVQMNGSLYLISDILLSEKLWKIEDPAADPQMLVEFTNPDYVNTYMENLTVVGDTLFFSADPNMGAYDLWKSDGTPAGTVLVKDLGAEDEHYSLHYFLTDVNGTLFFAAREDLYSDRIWKSDGTTDGTQMVKDIPPAVVTLGSSVVSSGELLFFVGRAGQSSDEKHELWRSDGTAAGTIMPKDINPSGDAVYNMLSSDWLALNGVVYFRADDGSGSGYVLWRSDGTGAGTLIVKAGEPVYPGNFASIGNQFYFRGGDSIRGSELWQSDGTADGTLLVKDINPLASSSPMYLTNVNGTLFFIASDGTHGLELWKSDGTEAGTVLVKDINVEEDKGCTCSSLTNVNGTLYFSASDGEHGKELWKSDGTSAGTVMVADLNPGSLSSTPGNLTVIDSTLYFVANDGIHDIELWALDTTTTSTGSWSFLPFMQK